MENNETPVVETLDLRDVIFQSLKSDERSLSWLQRKIGDVEGLGYNNLYAIFVEKRVALNQAKLDSINLALGTTYTLPAE